MVFFGELKALTCICFAAYAMESISKSGISLVISELINEVENGQQPFILGIGLCLLNLTCIICRHHGQNYAMTFSSKARMTLINLVFIKLT
jgi:ATP-binding cassette subfamily C (CFTR/MRP) protein 4